MYVKTVRNTSQILRIDCVNGAGTRKGLILHRFALSVGKDVLLHGMVYATTVVQNCQLRNVPISPSKRLIDADLGIT